MEIIETVQTGAKVRELYDLVADLSTYPDWLRLVEVARPLEPGDDGVRAWSVELRGRIGPLARSKRLRMVRQEVEGGRLVRFDRVELDGRDHAPWRLEASVANGDGGALLTMSMYYGGSRFAPVLAPILRDEIRRGRRELLARYPR